MIQVDQLLKGDEIVPGQNGLAHKSRAAWALTDSGAI